VFLLPVPFFLALAGLDPAIHESCPLIRGSPGKPGEVW
jgi:hypothetical protein